MGRQIHRPRPGPVVARARWALRHRRPPPAAVLDRRARGEGRGSDARAVRPRRSRPVAGRVGHRHRDRGEKSLTEPQPWTPGPCACMRLWDPAIRVLAPIRRAGPVSPHSQMYLRDLTVELSDLAELPAGYSARAFHESTHAVIERFLDQIPRRKV